MTFERSKYIFMNVSKRNRPVFENAEVSFTGAEVAPEKQISYFCKKRIPQLEEQESQWKK